MERLLTILLFAIASNTNAQTNTNFQLFSHILDITKGMPAQCVTVQLEKIGNDSKSWIYMEEKTTDANGRISDFLKADKNNTGT